MEPLPAEEPRHLYLAGSDLHRAETFQRLYLDPAVRALFVTRGGYGAARMLPLLDRTRLAAAPPRHVAGFSDATALAAYLNSLGVQAIHGPCLAAPGALSDFSRGENLGALRRLLFEPDRPPRFEVQGLGKSWRNPEPIRGRLIGGNLSVWVTTVGTPWEVDPRGAILFLEDVDEAPYRIDRMLTHLRTAGRLAGVRALVFGHLQRCDAEPPGLLDQVLADLFASSDLPVFTGLPAGHGDPNLALPLGALAEITPSGEAGAVLSILP